MRSLGLLRHSTFTLLILMTLAFGTPGSSAAEPAGTPAAIVEKLQLLVTDLKERLDLPAPVVISVVPSNKLMMSVEAPADESSPFMLSIDASFLETLTDDELEAAIAHELGHVWVFTHHPFLQTEAACQSDRDARRESRKPRARVRKGVGARRREGRPRAFPRTSSRKLFSVTLTR